MGNNSNNNISWSTPFVGGYCVGGSANYSQWRGDKGSTWAITNMQGKYKPEDNLDCTDGKYAQQYTGGGNTGSIGVSMCGMLGLFSCFIE